MEFQYMCELLVRKLFQCGRFDDPLGNLANTDNWSGLYSDNFSELHRCKIWAVLTRLQNQYLESNPTKQHLFEESEEIMENILNATTNNQLVNAMIAINNIVVQLDIKEYPHINYRQTNYNPNKV
jgi:hypothetical protein